jgi:hypothetical protein
LKFEVLPGRKGENDKLVKIWSYGEVLPFRDLLFILDCYFKSENDYYPKPQFLGSTMLLEAIIEVYSGIPLEKILKRFKLNRKEVKTAIIEKMERGV